jgi:hypothetical protein
VNVLEDFLTAACAELGLDRADLPRDLVLDLTKTVAHSVARPAAPLSAYLLGLAAGHAGADVAGVRDLVARLSAVAERFTADG